MFMHTQNLRMHKKLAKSSLSLCVCAARGVGREGGTHRVRDGGRGREGGGCEVGHRARTHDTLSLTRLTPHTIFDRAFRAHIL